MILLVDSSIALLNSFFSSGIVDLIYFVVGLAFLATLPCFVRGFFRHV